MNSLSAVIPYDPKPYFEKTLLSLTRSGLIRDIVIVSQETVRFKMEGCRVLLAGPFTSQATVNLMLDQIRTKYLLLLPRTRQVSIEPKSLERFIETAKSTRAGLIYSDFYDETGQGRTLHPLSDYQFGSVRDDFDFGPIILFSVDAIRGALKKYGAMPGVIFAGFYNLRLKVSIDHSLYHLPEPLYSVFETDKSPRNAGAIRQSAVQDRIFAYVDPRNEAAQKEMETIFTDYLKKIGAYLPRSHLREVRQRPKSFPVEASIVIPVRNRKETIGEALKSALSQETGFPFNIIVVDNHSTDGTTAILSDLGRQYPTLKHIIPKRTDLGIGACWNEAIHAEACGRYAVQLDSDDLYSGSRTLQKLIDMLRQDNYAMVVGSYTLVDSGRKEISPGLVNHREWTDENGHNNALRINGLGAPRAFNTDLMRRIGFLNVSYGEDYAAALRICREYRIGRIYESLYLCRRWSGNTDAALSIEEVNRNDAFKDKVRTDEILARQKMNLEVNTSSPLGGRR
jgi:hypothetical protein